MTEPYGDESDQQMEHLDQPVIVPWKQTQLRDTEGRNEEAPDQNDEGEPASSAGRKSRGGEDPHADDEQDAEHHVRLQQRQRVPGPEEDPEHDESDAEDAEEQARNANDRFHGGLAPGERRRELPSPSSPAVFGLQIVYPMHSGEIR